MLLLFSIQQSGSKCGEAWLGSEQALESSIGDCFLEFRTTKRRTRLL